MTTSKEKKGRWFHYKLVWIGSFVVLIALATFVIAVVIRHRGLGTYAPETFNRSLWQSVNKGDLDSHLLKYSNHRLCMSKDVIAKFGRGTKKADLIRELGKPEFDLPVYMGEFGYRDDILFSDWDPEKEMYNEINLLLPQDGSLVKYGVYRENHFLLSCSFTNVVFVFDKSNMTIGAGYSYF